MDLLLPMAAALLIWSQLDRFIDVKVEILEEMDQEDVQNKKGEEEAAEEDDGLALEDSLFIPLTWGKKMPRTFYRGSDPEWQDFIKIAKDKPRHKKIQNELVNVVFDGCVKHPAINKLLGKDVKIGKYWLDISFPDGPPQEYERSGIEIGDGFIAWSQQRISPQEQFRLTRALWPKAAFDSLWAMGKTLGGIHYRRIKQALGWEGKDPFSPEERYRHAMELMEKQQQGTHNKQIGKAGLDPDSNTEVVSASAASSDSRPSHPLDDAAQWLPRPFRLPLPDKSVTGQDSTDFPIAMSVFRSTLSKQWNPKKMEPPKGTFIVQGMVEIRGARGRMLVDVQSYYDPKVAQFIAVNAGVRNFKRWNQAPRGGP